MHSLNLKILTDFNVRSKRCWQSGRKNSREDGKPFQIMACSWERNEDGKEKQTQSSFLSRSQTYALLKQQMAVAAKSEVGFFILFMWFYCVDVWGFLLLLGTLSRWVWSFFYGASVNSLKLDLSFYECIIIVILMGYVPEHWFCLFGIWVILVIYMYVVFLWRMWLFVPHWWNWFESMLVLIYYFSWWVLLVSVLMNFKVFAADFVLVEFVFGIF